MDTTENNQENKRRPLVSRPLIWQVAPYFISIVLAVISLSMTRDSRLLLVVETVNPVFSLVSLLIGSEIASLSVILTSLDKPPLKALKEFHMGELMRYHTEALVSGFFCCLFSVLAPLYCKTTSQGVTVFSTTGLSQGAFNLWLFTAILAVLTAFRLGAILQKMIQFVINKDQTLRRDRRRASLPPQPDIMVSDVVVEDAKDSQAVPA